MDGLVLFEWTVVGERSLHATAMTAPVRRDQQFCFALLCAVSTWLSGLYAGLYWPKSGQLVHVDSDDLIQFNWTCPTVEAPRNEPRPSAKVEIERNLCRIPFAVAPDLGRFGNKFFDYLAARFTAQVLNNEIYITRAFADVYDNYFTGRKTPIVDWNYLQHKCGIDENHCPQLPLYYLPELKPISNVTFKCIRFYGFPVNIKAKAWDAIFSQRGDLLKEFRWKAALKKSVDEKLNQVKTSRNTSVTVAVHARRTDYRNYVVGFYGSFRPANASYYLKAMDYFRKKYTNPVFLVFSDDVNWCQQNLKSEDVIFPGNGDQNDPGFDLALISSCSHMILSYGTFGMAAAWFHSGGEVITADKFSGSPEQMNQELKKVPSLNWTWTPV